jgi:hypothetical protein
LAKKLVEKKIPKFSPKIAKISPEKNPCYCSSSSSTVLQHQSLSNCWRPLAFIIATSMGLITIMSKTF